MPRLRRVAAAALCVLLACPQPSFARVRDPILLSPAAVEVVPAHEDNLKGDMAPEGLTEAGASVSADDPAAADPGDGQLSLASNLSCQPPASPALDTTPRFHGGSEVLTPWGLGWSSDLDQSLVVESSVTLVWVDGNANRVRFFRDSSDEVPPIAYLGPSTIHSRITVSALSLGQPNQATMRDKDGTVRRFGRSTGDVVNPLSMTQLVDRNGNTVSYTRDGANRLTRVQDVHGRFVTLGYDNQGFINRLEDTAGRVFTYTYDAQGHKLTETGPEGLTSYSYDADNRISKITYPDQGVKNFTYDGEGRVLTEDDGGNVNRKSYVYEQNRTLITDANGGVTTMEFVERDGLKKPSRVTDPEGRVTLYTYDAAFNIASITDPRLKVTRFTYDKQGNVTVTEDPENGFTRASYEPTFNQPLSLTDPRNNQTLLEYDAKGNPIRVTAPLSHVTVNSYDGFGHLSSTRDPTDKLTRFTYDPANGALSSVEDPLTRLTSLQTDALSRVTRSQDPAGKATRYEYDAAGNLTKVTDHDGGVTQYIYEPGRPRKRLKQVIDAKNHATNFSYDGNGRLTLTSNARGDTRRSDYDDKGNLTQTINARGQVITYEYDGSDRLVKKVTPEGTFGYLYDAAGNLTRVGGPSGSVEMSYDGLSRVTQVIQTIGNGTPATIGYTYDANGNRTSMSTPWGSFNYTYDALNRLTELKNPENRVFKFEYDLAGRRTKLIYPNGIETRYVYDAAGQVTSIRHVRVSDQAVIAKAEYVYDAAGNRTSMTDLDGVHTYDYDNLHRLIEAVHPSTNTPVQHEVFSYDAVGNRLADARITGYTYDEANRLTSNSSFTYTYDADGNLTRKRDRLTDEITDYSYDSENRLVGVELPNGQNWTYKYDGLGRRIEKSSGTAAGQVTRYVYDEQDSLAMLNGANALRNLFTHGRKIDEPLQIAAQSGNDFFIHADGLGSIIAHTEENGSLLERIHMTVYGDTVFNNLAGNFGPASITDNPFGFTGREHDESGFMNFRARQTYDPLVGRFLQQDPLGIAAGVNVYQYVKSRPTRFSDPTGLVSGDPGEDLYYSDTPSYSPDVPDPYTAGDLAAGFGDTVTLGHTAWARGLFGYESGVNRCSTAYDVGRYAGYGYFAVTAGAVGLGLAGYSTLLAIHPAHHTFGRLGRLAHIQLNIWRRGVRNSGRAYRIPLPWR